jgi:hypothetical protein
MPRRRRARVGRRHDGHPNSRDEALGHAVSREIDARGIHRVVLLVYREIPQIGLHTREVRRLFRAQKSGDRDGRENAEHQDYDDNLDQRESLSDYFAFFGGVAAALKRDAYCP